MRRYALMFCAVALLWMTAGCSKAEDKAAPPAKGEGAAPAASEQPKSEQPKGEQPNAGEQPKSEQPNEELPTAGEHPKGEHPTGEHPKAEHPAAGEHPKGEHPTGEHPKAEHPAAGEHPKGEHPMRGGGGSATHLTAAEHPDHLAHKPSRATTALVVTADIQREIERHIEQQSQLNGGYFKLPYEGRELELKLVRVHTEYLASLGPARQFACVDLVDTEGDVYDVDFFMDGGADAMTVTETIAHKVNGKPFYAWEQGQDKIWKRVPYETAANHLRGVIEGEDSFEFVYEAQLPTIRASARMWLPIPQSDAFQTILSSQIDAPGKQQILDEAEHGNKILLLELGPQDSNKTVAMRFKVKRLEKAAYAEDVADPALYLRSLQKVPINDKFRKIGEQVVEGKKGDLVRARAIYDHVIEKMAYKKVGEGWGRGNAIYACDSRTGNCTDYHSYFLALTRAVGIPARFAIGAPIPSERGEGRIAGYHCWAEFYAEGKWWPVDISEGDKHSSLATYYFGHHPANRVELSRGRDLVVDPQPASGPINFLVYPVLEVDGETVKVKPAFSFVRGGA